MRRFLFSVSVTLAAHLGLPATAHAQFSAGALTTFDVGADPYGVVAADFNKDLRADVAAVNSSSSNVSVFLRQPSGSFTEDMGSPIAVGSGPNFAATGDFNGDGLSDLAVASFASGNVTVLLRQASGSFAVEGAPITLASASSVATADFNADGRLDLAVSALGGNGLSVLIRTTGGFTPETAPSVGPSRYVAVGDFNGDRRPDLVLTQPAQNSVTILLRQFSGFVVEGAAIQVGSEPYAAVSQDFNGDGRGDLAVTNTGSHDVTVLLRQPGTTFLADVASPYAVGQSPIGIAAGDFNTDGRPDLAVVSSASSSLTVLLRQSTRAFAAQPPVALPANPYALAVADFDSNNTPDLAVTLTSANKVAVLFNQPLPAGADGGSDASTSDAGFADASVVDGGSADSASSAPPDAGGPLAGLPPRGESGCSCSSVRSRDVSGVFGLAIALAGVALSCARVRPTRRNSRGREVRACIERARLPESVGRGLLTETDLGSRLAHRVCRSSPEARPPDR